MTQCRPERIEIALKSLFYLHKNILNGRNDFDNLTLGEIKDTMEYVFTQIVNASLCILGYPEDASHRREDNAFYSLDEGGNRYPLDHFRWMRHIDNFSMTQKRRRNFLISVAMR